MNGVSNNQDKRKDGVIKTLAIIGFTATIILAVWLAVQVVQIAPSAFTSLASLAESVHGTPQLKDFTVVTNKTVVNNGDDVELSWSDAKVAGVYRFAYECTDGVAITIDRDEVECGQTTALTGENSVTITVGSDEQRFIDVPYTLTFTEEGGREVAAADTNRITVVNASIPLGGLVAGTSDEEVEPEEEVVETETAPETPTETPNTPTTPAPAPEPQYVFTYELPESDPNGFTDLEIKYLGVGEVKGGDFVPHGTIDNDDQGAVRFSVKNIGTKTSEEWTYEILLPSGITHNSKDQDPLKPNEEATIVLGFTTSETGTMPIEGEVKTDDDRTSSNNDFQWSVAVTN